MLSRTELESVQRIAFIYSTLLVIVATDKLLSAVTLLAGFKINWFVSCRFQQVHFGFCSFTVINSFLFTGYGVFLRF